VNAKEKSYIPEAKFDKNEVSGVFAAGIFAMASGIDAFIREKFQCELIWKAELPNTAGRHLPVWH
jgi:hypothetical protein